MGYYLDITIMPALWSRGLRYDTLGTTSAFGYRSGFAEIFPGVFIMQTSGYLDCTFGRYSLSNTRFQTVIFLPVHGGNSWPWQSNNIFPVSTK